jgi:Ca2+-binding RTX toxin-like protein
LFDDGMPPPNGPGSGGDSTYRVFGAFTETDGHAVMDSANAPALLESAGPGGTFAIHAAELASDVDPALALESGNDFVVEAIFDLNALPDEPREAFGIRLSDRTDVLAGDDVVELVVARGSDGKLRVQVREHDFVNGEVNPVVSKGLNPGPAIDQIVLRLEHDADNPGVLTAEYDLLIGGVLFKTVQLLDEGHKPGAAELLTDAVLFGNETPGDLSDDESWTNAQFVAYAPDDAAALSFIEGNEKHNVLTGSDAIDVISGFGGGDKLFALAEADTLFGGEGNDFLDGGAGADSMMGGPGDDTYIADDIGDQVSESKAGADQGGFDKVESSVDFSLPDFVEKLVLTGTALTGVGSELDNVIAGNGEANTLVGLGGNDEILGRLGDDAIFGGSGADTLDGGGGHDLIFGDEDNDMLVGLGGRDSLDGGLGADTLEGGAGHDEFNFIVGQADGDVVVDFAGNGPLGGDLLLFFGYGPGATFLQVGATNQWEIKSADGLITETITVANGAAFDPSDFVFFDLL